MFPEWPHLFCTYLRLGRLFNKKICRGNKTERDYNNMHHYGNTRLIVIEHKITKDPFVWSRRDDANCQFKGRRGTKPFPSCHCPRPCLGHVTPQMKAGGTLISLGIPACDFVVGQGLPSGHGAASQPALLSSSWGRKTRGFSCRIGCFAPAFPL